MPLTVPDPAADPPPPPPGSELANVGGHFCKMKTFPSMFSEAPRTLK